MLSGAIFARCTVSLTMVARNKPVALDTIFTHLPGSCEKTIVTEYTNKAEGTERQLAVDGNLRRSCWAWQGFQNP